MNKKFTMMLAAFVAAGYSVTVEAGVVKFENPEKGIVSYALKASSVSNIDNLANESFVRFGEKAPYQYLVVKEVSKDNFELALVSEAAYLAMPVPTTWKATNGVLTVESAVANGKVVKLNDQNTALVLAASDGTAMKLLEGRLVVTVTPDDKYINYKDSKFIVVDDDSDNSLVYNAGNVTGVRPEALTSATTVSGALSLDKIKSDFRLVQYGTAVGSTTENSDYFFVYSNNGVTTVPASSSKLTYASAPNKTIYYWSIDKDGYFVNSNGSKFHQSKLTVVPAYTKSSAINAFYLRAANGKYIGADFALVDATSAKVFSALEAVQTPIDAVDLNKQVLGAYTSAFEYEETAATSNPFENVTAIDVTAGGKYVEGTYFVKNAPADVKLDKAYDATNADDLKKLNAMTFVAVDPTKNYKDGEDGIYIKTTVGAGAKFVEVSGNDLIANTQLTGKAGEVTTNNAAFSIKKNDSRPNEMYYELGTIYVDNSSNLQASTAPLYVAAVKLGADVVVTTTTVADNIPNNKYTSKSSANAVEYADFLKETARVFNIQFLSTTGAAEEGDKEKSLYKKYLTVGEADDKLLAQGAEFVDLSLPQNQWVVSNMTENNVITFTNRESGQSFTTTLVKTDNANEYSLFGPVNTNTLNYLYKEANGDLNITGTATLDNNTIVKLTEVSVSKNDGYESKAYEGYTKIYFSPVEGKLLDDLYVVVTETAATNNSTNETVSLNKAKATQFEVVRNVETEKAHVTNIAILKDGKPAVAENVKDTLEVVTYSFKQVRNDDLVKYLNDNMTQAVYVDTETASPAKFIIKKLNNGQVALVPFAEYAANNTLKADASAFQLNSNNNGVEADYSVYSATAEPNAYITLKGEVLNTSFESAPQHVLFQSAGKYMAVGENNAAIMEAPSALKAEYSKADLTFWLDTTDSEELVPTFYISKGSKEFMFNAADSLSRFNEGTASYEKVEAYQMPDDENAPRAIFRSGSLKDSDTFVTKIEDAQKELTAGKGIESYQYKIVLKDNAVSDEYVVRSAKNLDYLYEVNGALGFTDDAKKAIVFTIESTEAPTSNEGVSASDVKVVAQNGSVVVMNAAGKNVVVSTILGQVVVNEVLTSDNATISVPAGIVVVAVDGESFKVNVK